MPLPEDYVDNSSTLHAADVNAITTAINHQTTCKDHFRPLKGLNTDVTSVLASGWVTTGLTHVGSWNALSANIRYCGVVPVPLPSDTSLGYNNQNSAGGSFFQPIVIEFWSNATAISITGYDYVDSDFWCLVDDQRITEGWQHNTASGQYTWQLTQTDAVWHKYRVCLLTTISDLYVSSGSEIVPTTGAGVLQVGWIGDSYCQGLTIQNAVTEGTAGMIASGTPPGEFEQFSGVDVWRNAIDGTGYVNPGTDTADGTSAYGSSARMAQVALWPALDAVVIQSSVNDTGVSGYSSPDATVAAAQALWAAVKAAQPAATIIVLGLEQLIPASTSSFNAALNTALAAAADASTVVDHYVDFLAHPYLTGTGHDEAPENDGNADAFIASDGLHFTHIGARYIGEMLFKRISPLALYGSAQ